MVVSNETPKTITVLDRDGVILKSAPGNSARTKMGAVSRPPPPAPERTHRRQAPPVPGTIRTSQVLTQDRKVEKSDNMKMKEPAGSKDVPPMKSVQSVQSVQAVADDNWLATFLTKVWHHSVCDETRNDDEGKAPLNIMCGGSSSGDALKMNVCGSVPSGLDDDQNPETDQTDNESVASVSTIGRRIFGDLQSLPSISGSILPGFDKWGDDVSLSTAGNSSRGADESQSSSIDDEHRSEDELTENVIPVVEEKINFIQQNSTANQLEHGEQARTSGAESIQDNESDKSTADSRRQFLLSELCEAIDTHGRFDVRCANITAALGDLFDESKEYDRALHLHREAVAIYSAKLGDNHVTTMEARLRLGAVLENAGDFEGAIYSYYDVMTMRRATSGESDPTVSDVLSKCATVLRKKGRYLQAIRELKRALKIYRESLGDGHVRVSETVDEIASLYIQIGDFTKATAILEEVVKLKAATLGLNNKGVAASLVELSSTYECSGQYSKSMKALKKAYKIYTEVDSLSCSEAIMVLERMAMVYRVMGEIEKVVAAYLGALRGKKMQLGDSHPSVADTYFHLGVSLRESGRLDKGYKCMRNALSIYVGEGKDMHDVGMIAEVMREMALFHRSKDELYEALKVFKQELAVRRKMGASELPQVARTLNHLGVTEFELKNNHRALDYFVEALTIYENMEEHLGTNFAEILLNTALVFESIRQKERAYEAYMEASRIFKEHGYGDDHPQIAKAVARLRRMGYRCECRKGASRCILCKSPFTSQERET